MEDGKFYQVIQAAPPGGASSGIERDNLLQGADMPGEKLCKLADRYGPILLQKKTPVFLSFLEREAAVYEEILANLREQGMAEDKRRKRYVEVEALLEESRLAGTL